MVASEAQITANRANALKSCGPKTPEGKERSRRNALKHGLCSSVVVPEDVESFQRRVSEFYYTLKPQNYLHAWMVEQIALFSLRVDRAGRMERRSRDRHSLQAGLTWDADRRLQAESLGSKLARRPSETVEALRQTPQGCDWLLARWEGLERVAAEDRVWSADQQALAFDLLGTPAPLRDGRGPTGAPAEVARREIAALKEHREAVAELDEVDRALAEADLSDESNLELRRLRRYESALFGKIRWCMAQLKYESPHLRPHPDLTPRWVPEPESTPEPAPVPATDPTPGPAAEQPKELWQYQPPHPPFDLEPDELPAPGQEVDIPAIVAARRLKAADRAEVNRRARRRKLERLRA